MQGLGSVGNRANYEPSGLLVSSGGAKGIFSGLFISRKGNRTWRIL